MWLLLHIHHTLNLSHLTYSHLLNTEYMFCGGQRFFFWLIIARFLLENPACDTYKGKDVWKKLILSQVLKQTTCHVASWAPGLVKWEPRSLIWCSLGEQGFPSQLLDGSVQIRSGLFVFELCLAGGSHKYMPRVVHRSQWSALCNSAM
jgi:hypothetical protein